MTSWGRFTRRPRQTRKLFLQFLSDQGIQTSEIELGIIRRVDTQGKEYGGGVRAPHPYIVEQQIGVHTSRVDQLAAAVQKTLQLLQKGSVLGGNPGQGLAYKFSGLNAIQPDMITEATRNTRAAADRFAADSGSNTVHPPGQPGRVLDSARGPGGRRCGGRLPRRCKPDEDCASRDPVEYSPEK